MVIVIKPIPIVLYTSALNNNYNDTHILYEKKRDLFPFLFQTKLDVKRLINFLKTIDKLTFL